MFKEYKQVTDAIMVLWAKHGADKTCKACIEGPRGGCCQGCSNLRSSGCVEKPIICAMWACNVIREKHPALISELRELGTHLKGLFTWGYRTWALTEDKLKTYTPTERKQLVQIALNVYGKPEQAERPEQRYTRRDTSASPIS